MEQTKKGQSDDTSPNWPATVGIGRNENVAAVALALFTFLRVVFQMSEMVSKMLGDDFVR